MHSNNINYINNNRKKILYSAQIISTYKPNIFANFLVWSNLSADARRCSETLECDSDKVTAFLSLALIQVTPRTREWRPEPSRPCLRTWPRQVSPCWKSAAASPAPSCRYVNVRIRREWRVNKPSDPWFSTILSSTLSHYISEQMAVHELQTDCAYYEEVLH